MLKGQTSDGERQIVRPIKLFYVEIKDETGSITKILKTFYLNFAAFISKDRRKVNSLAFSLLPAI